MTLCPPGDCLAQNTIPTLQQEAKWLIVAWKKLLRQIAYCVKITAVRDDSIKD